jgi:hypothetical protein
VLFPSQHYVIFSNTFGLAKLENQGIEYVICIRTGDMGETVLGSAILKAMMAATWGRVFRGIRPKIDYYPKIYLCAKFCAFFTICTVRPIFQP